MKYKKMLTRQVGTVTSTVCDICHKEIDSHQDVYLSAWEDESISVDDNDDFKSKTIAYIVDCCMQCFKERILKFLDACGVKYYVGPLCGPEERAELEDV